MSQWQIQKVEVKPDGQEIIKLLKVYDTELEAYKGYYEALSPPYKYMPVAFRPGNWKSSQFFIRITDVG